MGLTLQRYSGPLAGITLYTRSFNTGVREGFLLGEAEKICPENNTLP